MPALLSLVAPQVVFTTCGATSNDKVGTMATPDFHCMMASSNGTIFRLTGLLSPVNPPHKGQWRGALMFYMICIWINGWVNNREAGDLKRHHAHYDVIVMGTEFRSTHKYLQVCLHSGLPVVRRIGTVYTNDVRLDYGHRSIVSSYTNV